MAHHQGDEPHGHEDRGERQLQESRGILEGYDRIKQGDLQKLGSTLGSIVLSSEKNPVDDIRNKMIVNGRVLVEVVGNNINSGESLRQSLESIENVEVVNCYKHICSVYCPVDKLVDLANLQAVRLVKPSLSFHK
jgi:hypothetical protein